jgi:2-haloacid dehalogenase
MPLRWVLFDLNGTLLDPSGVGEPLGLGAAESLSALDEAIVQSMADTLSGARRGFPGYLRAALERRARLAGRGVEALNEAMERAAGMPAYPDAAAAIEGLGDAGLSVGVLTNSARAAAEAALSTAGLRERLQLVVGADEAATYKPDPRVYRLGVERAGAEPGSVCLVAAHGWDLLGAGRVGLRTAWVARKERFLLSTVPEPDFRGETLLEVALRIADAAGRG